MLRTTPTEGIVYMRWPGPFPDASTDDRSMDEHEQRASQTQSIGSEDPDMIECGGSELYLTYVHVRKNRNPQPKLGDLFNTY